MTTTIAVSGKGGSGKTTIAAMIVRHLVRQGSGAVLAVDADPNSCLGLTLGVEPAGTVADIRENARTKTPGSSGTDKLRNVEYAIQQAITESKGFDLLTMGRPEGPSCYCAVNNMLRQFLDTLSRQYRYVVVDNEAGMEHLSRRTTNKVDFLCIVAEPSPVGVVTARRICTLAGKLPIEVQKIGLIWNKKIDKGEQFVLNDIETFGSINYDATVFTASMEGKTVFELPQDNPAFLEVGRMLEQFKVKLEL
jgi:CO dehydrogenase maturation factor